MRTFKNPCPGTRPPYPLPITIPAPDQQPGNFQLPETERIAEALGGLCIHPIVQEKQTRPCVCRKGSQQGGWLGIPTRVKSRGPLTCQGPMSWTQTAAELSVFRFRKSRVASSEILACGCWKWFVTNHGEEATLCHSLVLWWQIYFSSSPKGPGSCRLVSLSGLFKRHK